MLTFTEDFPHVGRHHGVTAGVALGEPLAPAGRPGTGPAMAAKSITTTRAPRTVRSAAPAADRTAPPRLRLEPTASRRTLLDGAWWPRSTDLLTELPALVVALDDRRGPVTHLMLGADTAGPHPRQLTAAGRRVRLGWFASQPAGLLTVICGDRERIDLLVVPAAATPAAAALVMAAAAQVANTRHAPELLATVLAVDPKPPSVTVPSGGGT
jgi:hypothetical protein